jgi:hypothetical protein
MKELFRWLLILMMLFSIFTTAYVGTVIADDSDETGTEDPEDTEDGSDETDDEDGDETKDEDDEDDEAEQDEIESAYEREIEIEVEEKKVQLKSQLKFGDTKDKIEIEFTIEEEAEVKFKYYTETADLETKLKFRVEFERIYEYIDTGDAGYQNESVITDYEFEEGGWNPIGYELVNNNTLHVITAVTADGVFTLVLMITDSLVQLDNNSTLTPNAIKIDVYINGFDYNSTESSLALVSKLKTEQESEVNEDTDDENNGFSNDEAELSMNSTEVSGFFSWIKTADADGSVIDVLSSLVVDDDEDDQLDAGETSSRIVFSFITVNAQKIVWDPKLGVTSDLVNNAIAAIQARYDSSGFSLPFSSMWILFISLVSGVALISRKRKAILNYQ